MKRRLFIESFQPAHQNGADIPFASPQDQRLVCETSSLNNWKLQREVPVMVALILLLISVSSVVLRVFGDPMEAYFASRTQRNPTPPERSYPGAINSNLLCWSLRNASGKYQTEPCGW